jgi:hypothetical protein
MAHELLPLPYDYSALEPTIDAQTMKLHHDIDEQPGLSYFPSSLLTRKKSSSVSTPMLSYAVSAT